MDNPNNGRTPVWVNEFIRKYQDGVTHSFLLHFNVSDYVIPGVTLKTYLSQMFNNRKIVVFYNRSEGLSFPLPMHRDKFIETLGLNTPTGKAEAQMAGLGEGKGPNRSDPKVALSLLTRLLRLGSQDDKLAAVVIEYAETIFPEGSPTIDDRTNLVMALQWGRDPQIILSGNPVFLVTENLTDMHSAIRAASSRWESIEIPLPDQAKRLQFVEWYLSCNAPDNFAIRMSSVQLANATAGLSLIHLEDIFLRAFREGELTMAMVRNRKREIIRSEFGDVLEVWDPRYGFGAIGGLEHVKRFFIRNVIDPIHKGNYNRVPMGVLMTGPAGTGKSIMAEAIAYETGVQAAVLNPAKIFDKYVGTSERNMEKVLRAIVAMAPVVVFIDEIDQAASRGEAGDSGVSNRIFKRLLEFMADTSHRGKVLILAATNRPDLMDAALRRPGRLDKKIPFLIPDASERSAIIQVMIGKYFPLDGDQSVEISTEVIEATEGWTGAELESATIKALEIMQDEDLNPSDALAEAVVRIFPSTKDIEYMTLLALNEVDDLDLLPARYRETRRNQAALQAKINEIRPTQRGQREL